jgi:hypothetical protein
LDARHRPGLRQAPDKVGHRRAILARREGAASVFDQHRFGRALARELLSKRPVGQRGLAIPLLPGLERHHPRRAADHERGDHERQPSKDRRLAVSGAPARRACREVL